MHSPRSRPACRSGKKGATAEPHRARNPLERLTELVGRRKQWQDVIGSLKRMRDWVLTTEQILSGAWADSPATGEPSRNASRPAASQAGSPGTTPQNLPLRDSQEARGNATVSQRFDQWCTTLAHMQATGPLTEEEQRCLAHFLQITHNLRPRLVLCYDRSDFPRTNHDMEGSIRSLKTRYRRISGRKHWNNYLLRYGRCVAYYDCLHRAVGGDAALEARLKPVSHPQWQAARLQCRDRQSDQLKRWRFRHKRAHYLRTLEQRWAQTTAGTASLH